MVRSAFSIRCLPILALLSVFAGAHAGMLAPTFKGTSLNLEGTTTFHYDLGFDNGANTNPNAELHPGNFITLFDVIGLVSVTAPQDFSVSTALVGQTAQGTNPVDDPSIVNVTFTYSGPPITTDSIFAADVVSTYGGTRDDGWYSSMLWKPVGNNVATFAGNVTVPGAPVPEPCSLAALVLGAGVLICRARRSKVNA